VSSVPNDAETNHRGLLGACSVGAVLILALALGTFQSDSSNPDLFWHLRTGQWIVENRAIPHTDMYSFSRSGLEWIDSQWLFQTILYGFFFVFGEAGINLLVMTVTAGLAALLMAAPVDPVPKEWRAAAGVLVLLAINPRVYPRPELLSCLYLASLFFFLERTREGGWRWLGPVILIQWLFANSEGLWPIGVGIIAAYGLARAWIDFRDRRLSEWRRRLSPWAATLTAGVLVNLFQPYGLRGFIFPFLLLREILLPGMAHKNVIGEFAPLYSDPKLIGMALPFLALTAAALGTALLSGRKFRPFLSLLSLVMVGLAVNAVRNLSVSGVVLGGLLTANLPALLERRPSWLGQRGARTAGLATIGAALIFSLLSLAPPVRRWDSTFRTPGLGVDWKSYPVESARFLHGIGYRGGIVNPDWMGGYLIWSGWPEWKVMTDTRMEVGGQEAILFCFKVYNNMATLNTAAGRFGADAVVMSFEEPYTKTFRMVLADPGWALVQLDRNGGVFLRRGSAWDREIARHEIKNPLQYEIKIR
jgi:hypothetical protein